MVLRAYPINSPVTAAIVPGVNDYDLTRVPTELLTEGVVRGFAVTQRAAGANMTVEVSAGLALIEITNTNVAHGRTYKTWFESTGIESLSVTTADGTNARKDRLVLRIDVSQDPNAASSNIAVLELLAGTPAGSPTAQAEPANAITLAIIDVPASDASVTDDQITDSRTFVELDPDVLADVARVADMASTATGKGASGIGVEDAAGNFAGETVEEVLAELHANVGTISDDAYDATAWNGVTDVAPSKNAVRDKIESMDFYPGSFVAGTAVLAQAAAAVTVQNTGYTKKKEIRVNMGGTIRVSFNLRVASALGTAKGRIYVNGVAVGTERTNSSTGGVDYTEDITVVAGDLVQLYISDNMTNHLVTAESFTLLASKVPSATVILN
ncbi:MAG TPA: hypothetical protein VGN57_18965 [Pirellulaceae bacterium]|jgi:hypothetical protein|nr:hypothetical protein [Pirellulaceae bacterium]